MHTRTTVAQWGNSLAIRLPQALVMQLSLKCGEQLALHVDSLGFRAVMPDVPSRFSLEELLAGIRPDNTHTEQDWGMPLGREVLAKFLPLIT